MSNRHGFTTAAMIMACVTLGCGDGGAAGDAESHHHDGNDEPAEGTPGELSDAEIGAVTSVVNAGEIAQAQAALPKLSNRQVLLFAERMVELHGAAQSRQAELLQSKGLMPSESYISTELQEESDAVVAALADAAPSETDFLYIDKQITVHTNVLAMLDDILIPSATDADLRAELEATRRDVEAHLGEAKFLKDALVTRGGAP